MADMESLAYAPVNKQTRLILVGKTGSGKSSLGNILLQRKNVKMPKKTASAGNGEGASAAKASVREDQGGSNTADCQGFAVRSSMSSGTKSCGYKVARTWDRHLKVVDTPGLCDTDVDIRMTLIELTNVMSLSVPGPHAVLFVIRLDLRFTEEENDVFQKILEMFHYDPKQSELTERKKNPEQKGKSSQRNLLDFLFVVFTHGEQLDEDDCTIEEALEEAPPRLKAVMNLVGDKYAVISKTDDPEKRSREVKDLLRKVDGASQDGDVFYANDALLKMTNLLNEEIENVMKERKISREEADSLVKEELVMDDTTPWSPLQISLLLLTLLSSAFVKLHPNASFLISLFRKPPAESVAEKKSFIVSVLAKLEDKSRERKRKCVIS